MPEESKNKMMLKQKGGGGHCRISFNIFEYIMIYDKNISVLEASLAMIERFLRPTET